MSLLSIGTSGLTAAYAALRTTGNNITNVNTVGYTRQTVVLSPQVSTSVGGLYLGAGVNVDAVKRNYNELLSAQANLATANSAQADARATQLAQVAALFADSTTDIGSAISNFFSAVQDLTQSPADASLRTQLVSAGNLLVQRFNDVGDQLASMRNAADSQINLELASVNRTVQQIAALNQQIALAQGAGSDPNDLLDQRDAAIRTLNESIRVSAVTQDDGSINLFLGNGQPLVVGNTASTVALRSDPSDPQKMQIGVQTASGSFLAVDDDAIGGGAIAGWLQFRNDDLSQVENELGRLATALTAAFNEQHRLGNDASGAAAGDFFTPVTFSAYALSSNGNPATSVSAVLADASALQASDYEVGYDGSNYTLTRLSDGTQWTSASPSFTQDGLTITLADTPPAAGDRFLVKPYASVASNLSLAIVSGSQVAAASPVQASIASTNIGTLTVDALDVNGPTRDPNLTDAVSVVFTSASAYEIRSGATVLASGSYSVGAAISYNGWSLTLRGTPAAGDTVSIGATTGNSGDNRNALALAGIASLKLVGGATLSNGYANVVATVGGAARSTQIYATAQASILDNALSAESAVAGVNLDEEAAKLIQYQQQYQAAAKIISVGTAIFDEILALGR